jgi:hypothetical protein
MSDTHDPAAAPDAIPLPKATQTRNLLVYAGCMGLIYLAAPVLYVGGTQAALCRELNASPLLSNMPGTVYFAMTFMPVLIAWYWPYVWCLRRNVVLCFLATAASLAVVAVVLPLEIPTSFRLSIPWPRDDLSWGRVLFQGNDWKILAVVLQAGVSGITNPTAVGLLWEMIGRGVDEKRRGLTLGLAFGIGPLLAVTGSFAQALLLGTESLGLSFEGLPSPWGFVALYGMSAPIMMAAALLASRCTVPLPEVELARLPFLAGTFGGLFKFLGNRVLLLATIVTILIYTGNTIGSNMTLFAEYGLGDAPYKYAGTQGILRFGFKFAAGLMLGWLLTRTNPRAGILATGALFVSAMLWAIFARGQWFLVAYGLYGAGELVGVYAPNYILSASRKADFRRNMAFVQMLMVPTAPAGMLFGWIAERYGNRFGPAEGFQISFAVCAALMVCGMVLALIALPRRPKPQD